MLDGRPFWHQGLFPSRGKTPCVRCLLNEIFLTRLRVWAFERSPSPSLTLTSPWICTVRNKGNETTHVNQRQYIFTLYYIGSPGLGTYTHILFFFFFFLFSLKLSNPESYGPMRQPSTSREYCLLSFLVWPPRQARGHPASLPVRAGDPRACRGQHPGPLGLPQHHPLANLAPHLPSAASGFWYPLRALPFGSPKWGSSLPGIRDPREPGSPRLLDDRGARSIDCFFVP